MNALLILNENAGSLNGDKQAVSPGSVLEAVRATGAQAELRVAPRGQLRDTIEAVIRERPDSILVGGGDGTISTAADCLVETGIALGVLPLGTLNHFARDLGFPTDSVGRK